MDLIDTHTHPHMEGYSLTEDEFAAAAAQAGVASLICVGTSAADSARAIEFASRHDNYFASVGLHPHEARNMPDERGRLVELSDRGGVVAIGECGLDYYYVNSPIPQQKEAFHWQIKLAQERRLPLVFHVRGSKSSRYGEDAFDDFFSILDEHGSDQNPIRGVVHSFSSSVEIMQECVTRGLHIGLNGIMTFTQDEEQLAAAREVPLNSLVLETDTPFLTPAPFRGTVNNSGHVRTVAEFLSRLRGESLTQIADSTTANAKELFKL